MLICSKFQFTVFINKHYKIIFFTYFYFIFFKLFEIYVHAYIINKYSIFIFKFFGNILKNKKKNIFLILNINNLILIYEIFNFYFYYNSY